MFAEQDKNVVCQALPVWVQVVEVKQFPNAPKTSQGWIVYHRCCCKTEELLFSKTRHKATIKETAAALAKAIERAHSVCQPVGEATTTAAAAPQSNARCRDLRTI